MESVRNDAPKWLQHARDGWHHRGEQRPPFAEEPGPGQESVWDYPRPPLVVPDRRTVEVAQAEGLVASTDQSVQLLETSHPPAFYLPPESVISGRLRELSNPSAGDIRIHTRNSPTTPHGSRSTQAGSAAPWMESLCDLKPVVSTGDGSPTTLSARSRVSPARLGGERSTTTETCRLADFNSDEANQRRRRGHKLPRLKQGSCDQSSAGCGS